MVDDIGKMRFRRMDEGTDADFAVLARVHQEAIRKLPDQLMGILTRLTADEAYPVDRLQHSLEAATRALRQPPQDRPQRARSLSREPALRPHRRVLRALRRGVLRSRLPERADDHLRAHGAAGPAPRLDAAQVEGPVGPSVGKAGEPEGRPAERMREGALRLELCLAERLDRVGRLQTPVEGADELVARAVVDFHRVVTTAGVPA
jgi:hypothetical protein